MVPAGYLLKRVPPPPEWLGVPHLVEGCSVAACVSEDVVDVQDVWRQNSFGVASDPATLWRLA